MKKARKIITLILALVMVFSMSMTAWAANITIKDGAPESEYAAYRLLNATDLGAGKFDYTVHDKYANVLIAVVESKIEKDGEITNTDIIDYISSLTGEDKAESLRQFAKDVYEKIKEESIDDDGESEIDDDTSDIVFKGVEQGYYLIAEETLGDWGDDEADDTYSLVMLDTAGEGDITVTTKELRPTLTKEIVDNDNVVTESNNLSIGDMVQFKLTAEIPSDAKYYDYYYCIFSDKLSEGLTFINDGNNKLEVEADGGETDPTYTLYTGKDPDKVNEYADGNTFQVALTNAKALAGQTVTVTYWAKLNEDAEVGDDINDTNTNTATLEYSNDPNTKYGKYDNEDETPGKPDPTPEQDPEDPLPEIPMGETPEQETRTYTTGIKIIKTDGEEPLPGAEFTITDEDATIIVLVSGDIFEESEEGTYYKLTNGTYTTTEPETDGSEDLEYDNPETKYVKVEQKVMDSTQDVEVKAFVDDDGYLTFQGLGQGTYQIEETVVPAGYNPIDPIEVEIVWNGEDAEDMWTATITSGAVNNDDLSFNDDGIFELTVVNQSGTELPSTGGIGTTIFYIAGGILVLVAVVLLVTKKRMKADE